MKEWLILNEITGLDSYAAFRISKNELQNLSEGKIGLYLSKKYTPLRLAIEKALDSTKWFIDTEILYDTTFTKGVCSWKDDPEQKCGHHDGSYIKDWVMIKTENGEGFEQLWSRERGTACVSDGWHHDQIRGKFGYNGYKNISPERVILWNKNARSLGNIM
jgi:hypothetical protein